MTRAEFVAELVGQAKEKWGSYWGPLPDEQRLRLAGMEEELRSITRDLARSLWALWAEELDRLAVELEGQCTCGRRRERRKGSIELDVLGHRVQFPCTYLYCRYCRQGLNPVRRWLGLEQGGVSLCFERAVTDLTTRMTFGDAVDSMHEHHEQQVDRTKAERVTYAVGREGEEYLKERRKNARTALHSGEREGSDQLVFTADGGAVPVGKLVRPKSSEGPKTEVRKLAKGTRTISGREARFIAVHPAESNAERVVDCHIAPYEDTLYTGERMFAAAIEAGLSETSQIHGVYDMGTWIRKQFEEQFYEYEHSACADIMHVAGYLIDAGRAIAGQDKAVTWGMERKRRMLAGEYDKVLAELAEHKCDSTCAKNESGKCLAQVGHGYLDNHGEYMKDYEDFMVRGLPVGSGEAESGIRHVIKRRMAVAGAWEEGNARLVLGLLAIRASGWWDDFWEWRAQRDRQAWRERQEGKVKVLFRGRRGKERRQQKKAAA